MKMKTFLLYVVSCLIIGISAIKITFLAADFVHYQYLNNFSHAYIHSAKILVMPDNTEFLQARLDISNHNNDKALVYIQTSCEIHDNLGYLVFRKNFTGVVAVPPSSKETVVLSYTKGKYLPEFDKFKPKCRISYLSFEKAENDFIDD